MVRKLVVEKNQFFHYWSSKRNQDAEESDSTFLMMIEKVVIMGEENAVGLNHFVTVGTRRKIK